jgi:hypothetical protein
MCEYRHVLSICGYSEGFRTPAAAPPCRQEFDASRTQDTLFPARSGTNDHAGGARMTSDQPRPCGLPEAIETLQVALSQPLDDERQRRLLDLAAKLAELDAAETTPQSTDSGGRVDTPAGPTCVTDGCASPAPLRPTRPPSAPPHGRHSPAQNRPAPMSKTFPILRITR